MSKQRNPKNHRTIYEKVYTKYLKDAAGRGILSSKDAKFWSSVYDRTIDDPGYSPFRYLYRKQKSLNRFQWN